MYKITTVELHHTKLLKNAHRGNIYFTIVGNICIKLFDVGNSASNLKA